MCFGYEWAANSTWCGMLPFQEDGFGGHCLISGPKFYPSELIGKSLFCLVCKEGFYATKVGECKKFDLSSESLPVQFRNCKVMREVYTNNIIDEKDIRL